MFDLLVEATCYVLLIQSQMQHNWTKNKKAKFASLFPRNLGRDFLEGFETML
jgi:hypothetical protein